MAFLRPLFAKKNYHVLGQVAGIIRDLLQAARRKNEVQVLLIRDVGSLPLKPAHYIVTIRVHCDATRGGIARQNGIQPGE
jgi:hypothetical protein